MTDLENSYVLSVRQRTGRARTESTYRESLAHFREFLAGRSFDGLPSGTLTQFAEHLTAKKYSAKSVTVWVGTARTFLRWLSQHGHDVPAANEKPTLPRISSPERIPLSMDELRRLSIATSSWELHYRLIVHVLPLTGMRIGEACAVETKDLRLGRLLPVAGPKGSVFIELPGEITKNHNPRLVPIHPALKPMLASWLRTVPIGPLFGMTIGQAQKRLRTLSDAIGKPIYPHLMRHTFRTMLMNARVMPERRDCLLGHGPGSIGGLYEHHLPIDLMEAVASLDTSWIHTRENQ